LIFPQESWRRPRWSHRPGRFALTCDVNNDGSIDKQDITLITQALNKPASGARRSARRGRQRRHQHHRLAAVRAALHARGVRGPAANTPPVAGNDTYNTNEDTPFAVAAPGVLGNDTDADGNPLTAALVTGPAQGTLLLNANGSFNYSPPPNFAGPVSFTYRANDGTANSNVATVSITVNPVDDAPVGNPDTYSTPEDTTLNVGTPGVLGNDTDLEGDPLAASLVAGPPAGAGTLTLSPNGSFVFVPAANFTGAATFTYRAGDGVLLSSVTTVTINVTPVDDAPVANPDNYSTNEDTALNVAAPGVLGNDTDIDGPALTAQLVTAPATGALTLNANGSFTYTPAANASGPVTFTYRANDGTLNSNPATVTITVLPVNDAPVAQNDSYSTPFNTTLNVVGPGVLGNDVDQEGNGLTAIKQSDPASGALTLNANGSFTYVPATGFSGPVSFTYKANDGTNDSNVATVSITVSSATNTPPVANADGYNTNLNTPLNVAAPGVWATIPMSTGTR
jgi:VCBS repeat-containing protein